MLETKLTLPSLATSSCCTCARLLPSTSASSVTVWNDNSEKPQVIHDRTLPCCGRIICAHCIADNERFANYCPFCQLSTQASALPSEGLREPPSYKEEGEIPAVEAGIPSDEPPSYADVEKGEKGEEKGDVIHHLHHPRDTISSISLLYNIPPSILRTYNNLPSDHLLLARHTILIPASHYQGPSLSSEPQVSEEEQERKRKIRRFMVGCKVPEYDVAVLYLEQAGWDGEVARRMWGEDERWEREHPLQGRGKERGEGKGKGKGGMSEVWRRRFMGKKVDEN